MPAGNGYYDPRDGSIDIDLNAGDEGSAMLSTIAHELTHFIQDWSPEKYRTFCRILMEGYADRGQSVRELVLDKQAKYRQELGIELTYEQAYDEVIASSMESVLNDGNVMDLLDQLETADKSLWEKFRNFLEEIADLIHRTIQAFRGVHPESPEGRIVERMTEIHAQLQQAFAEGLHEGGENYRTGGQKNTAQTGGVKYTYAGRTANNANMSLLDRARQMDENGANVDDIRQSTGWHKGKDGKWRFEIDDSKMEISENVSNYMQLGDILKHDELFTAYPSLTDVPVVFQSLPDGVQGRYDRSFGGIDISYQLKKDQEGIKDVLVHEIQHVIQHWEGFASGTSVEAWRRRIGQGYDARPARFQQQEKNAAAELQKIRQENPKFYQDMMNLSQMEPSVPRGAIDWQRWNRLKKILPNGSNMMHGGKA